MQRETKRELIGDLNGPVATVDHAGTVAPLGAGWQVAWAVGSGKRWHITAAEPAVRFRLLDDMPVAVTAMRVLRGDIVSTAAAFGDASGRAVTIEFRNESTEPVTLAVAVMPQTGRANNRHNSRAEIRHVEVRGRRILADDRVAVELDQRPGGAVGVADKAVGVADSDVGVADSGVGVADKAAGAADNDVGVVDSGVSVVNSGVGVADSDVWTAVRSEPSESECSYHSPDGRAAAAIVLPLLPGTPRLLNVPVSGHRVTPRSPRRAVGGWQAVVGRAASLECVDHVAVQDWHRGIVAAILASSSTDPTACALAALVLDQVGLATEADRSRHSMLAESQAGLAAKADRGRHFMLVESQRRGRYQGWGRYRGHGVLGLRGRRSRHSSRSEARRMSETRRMSEARGRSETRQMSGARQMSGDLEVLALRSLASRRLRGGRLSDLDAWAGPLADAAGSRLDSGTVEQVAAALSYEAPAAARDARRLIKKIVAGTAGSERFGGGSGDSRSRLSPDSADDNSVIAAVFEAIMKDGSGGDTAVRLMLVRVAAIASVLRCLLSETPDTLTLAAALPGHWAGNAVDVRGLRTRHGSLSFSLRWHGSHPALLWQRTPLDHMPLRRTPDDDAARPDIKMRCGLDLEWSSTELSGEVLLAAAT